MRQARRILVPVLAVFVVVFVAACGSDSPKKAGSAQEVLSETFGPDKPVKSGQLNLALRFNSTGLEGLEGAITAALTGPFQSKGGKSLPAFDFDLKLNAAGADFTAGAVSTGDKGYLKLQGTTYGLSDKLFAGFAKSYKDASKDDGKASDDGPSLQTLGIDPRRWLTAPRKVGTEEVAGESTTHVTARVDVAKLLLDIDKLLAKADTIGSVKGAPIPKALTAKQRTQLTEAVKSATFDVWSGVEDGTLRRLLVKVAFEVPQAAQSSAGGLKNGDLTVDLTISELNKPQTVTAPTNARPMAELTKQLSQFFGGALGGSPDTDAGSGSSTGIGAGSSGSSSEYLSCLGEAGTSITKVQECASLLGK